MPLHGERHGVGHHLPRQRIEPHGLVRCARCGALLLPRQHHQLFDKLGRAINPRHQPRRGLSARGLVGCALQPLHLQPQRRQRRTQLMRCIGHEMLLRLKRSLHAREQRIELVHQRQHLVAQPLGSHWREILRAPRRDVAPHTLHRRK
ncbi:hypothetical protein SDC9_113477 [bioreactor metagenome]|uniref:Uncharacterized protein n=1 Tax=bioreactor metagenome TaxID=1076179 RepID=A0A645BMU9_9ZZZZ